MDWSKMKISLFLELIEHTDKSGTRNVILRRYIGSIFPTLAIIPGI